MIGAADHVLRGDAVAPGDFIDDADDVRRAGGGLVGVDERFGDADLAARGDGFDVAADGLHDGFAACGVDVADVDLQCNAAGNAVDGAGIDVAGADGGYGVDDFRRERMFLDGQDNFGGGTERVAA